MSSNPLVPKGAPKTALVISQTCDDPARVLTAVQYAGLGNAKIILAQLTAPARNGIHGGNPYRRRSARQDARIDTAAEHPEWPRIWSEILNRVFLLGNIHIGDIPDIARAMGAHQLLLSSPQVAEDFWQATYGSDMENIFDAPVWILGRSISTCVPQRIKRILLPLSLRTGFDARLRTASQLAGASGATLAILHVISDKEMSLREAYTPWTVNARLQQFFKQLYDAPCPLEISIRDGNPADAILKFDSQHTHDLVILRSAQEFGSSRPFCGTTRRILNEVSCPVLLTRPESPEKQTAPDLFVPKTSSRNVMLLSTSGAVQ